MSRASDRPPLPGNGSPRARSWLRRFTGSPGDHAAIGAVGLVVAVDRLPQWNESKENRLAATRIGDFVQQVEGGNPVDLAALKAEAVTNFDETGDQGRFEIRIGNVFAGRILAFGRRAEKCSAAGEGVHLLPHGSDGPGVSGGESGGGQPLQFLGQLGTILAVKLLPGSAVFTLICA